MFYKGEIVRIRPRFNAFLVLNRPRTMTMEAYSNDQIAYECDSPTWFTIISHNKDLKSKWIHVLSCQGIGFIYFGGFDAAEIIHRIKL